MCTENYFVFIWRFLIVVIKILPSLLKSSHYNQTVMPVEDLLQLGIIYDYLII